MAIGYDAGYFGYLYSEVLIEIWCESNHQLFWNPMHKILTFRAGGRWLHTICIRPSWRVKEVFSTPLWGNASGRTPYWNHLNPWVQSCLWSHSWTTEFSRDAILMPCARYGGKKLSKDFLLRESNSKAFVDAVEKACAWLFTPHGQGEPTQWLTPLRRGQRARKKPPPQVSPRSWWGRYLSCIWRPVSVIYRYMTLYQWPMHNIMADLSDLVVQYYRYR